MKDWAEYRGLVFSAAKSQAMCLEGRNRPDLEVPFVPVTRMKNKIATTSPVIYLGIKIDYKRSFWKQVSSPMEKSDDLFTRLRGLMSANWGLRQETARILGIQSSIHS